MGATAGLDDGEHSVSGTLAEGTLYGAPETVFQLPPVSIHHFPSTPDSANNSADEFRLMMIPLRLISSQTVSTLASIQLMNVTIRLITEIAIRLVTH